MVNNRGFYIRKIPLRFLLVGPFVLQIFVVVGLTGWISLRNGQRAVNELAAQLRDEVTDRIQQKLTDHLKTAPLVNQINIDALQLGSLELADRAQTQAYVSNQLRQFSNLSGITLATETPDYVGILYNDANQQVLSVWDHQHGGVIDQVLNQQGKVISAEPDRDYDHRKRPWYQAVVQAKQAIWQEPYVTINPQRLVISADRPFYDAQGRFLGVADAELTLSSISEFLAQIRIGKTGQTFIMERDGELVATSTTDPPFRLNATTHEPERMPAAESNNPLLRETSRFLVAKFGDLSQITVSQQLDFQLASQHMYVQVVPFQDNRGLDWLVVVAVPEADFMETIEANTHTTIWLCFGALGIATVIGLLTSHWLIQPILAVVTAADALSKGSWNQALPKSRFGELALLVNAFHHMAEQLQHSFNALHYNAYHDGLTGLLNQAAFRLRLQEAIAQRDHILQSPAGQSHYLFAVLFLDLDYFKLVNDSLGHLAGDQLLIAVTHRLTACVIKPPCNDSQNAIARFGGDEFVILLNPVHTMIDAIQIAHQIKHELQKPFDLDGKEVFISASIGIVMSNNGGNQPESFLRNADIALYRAKENGKSNYEVFDTQMHIAAVDRLQLETDLRYAIEQQKIHVHYQPIIDLSTSQITGLEALARWHHPQRGWVRPQEFIAIAEESGLIVPLGQWVMLQACQQMYLWQQQFPASRSMTISINLSSKQFLQPDLLKQLEQILCETQLFPHCLKLEITESIFMNSDEITQLKLSQIRQFGIQLCIDDFGTGYSSLNYLHRFPISLLKIDRSFVQQLDQPNSHPEIVEAIVVLAHKLRMDVIAEGVETIEQMHQLRQIGCEQVQGFLFSQPVEAHQITTYLASGAKLAVLNLMDPSREPQC